MNTLKIFQILSISIPIAFVLYLICKGKKTYNLTYLQVILGFGIKVLLGTVYGYIFLKFYNGDDTWDFFNESLKQSWSVNGSSGSFFQQLLSDPAYTSSPGIFSGLNIFLGDLEFWIQVKVLAILNLFTVSDYYLDMCLLNGLFFFGHYLLFKLILERYTQHKNQVFLIVFCFLPPVFWLSGIRGDGYLLLFVSLTLYSMNQILKNHGWKHFMGLIGGILGTLIFRPPIAALLMAALVVWTLIERGHRRPGLAFFGVYGFCVIVFFGSGIINPAKGLPAQVVSRQEAFFRLNGNTRFDLDTLKPDPISFIKLTPHSINNTLLRPFPWEAKGVLQAMSAMENILFLGLIGYFCLRIRRSGYQWTNDGFVLAMVGFFITVYLLIGYTVPFPGAIVRYKAIPELLLLATLAGAASQTHNK